MSRIALPRRPRRPTAIPLTPLVDVLLILLIFFMVTSTYLDLDMIPLAEPAEPLALAEAVPGGAGAAAGGAILVRLDAGGSAYIGARRLDGGGLSAEVRRRLAARPGAGVLVLPSSQASVQALVALLDALSAGGATRVQVLGAERGAVR